MRSIGLHVAALAVAFTSIPSLAARADDALSLYQAMEIVTGTDMRERPRGFAQCLEDVLVKVSGDARLRVDPRLAEAKQHAGDYVVSFSYFDPIAGTRPKDDQGTYDRSENLTVAFDPAKVDAMLTSLGAPPWHGPRPILIPVLSVHGRKPPAALLSADDASETDERAAFERVAAEAGIGLKIPAGSEFRKWGVGLDSVAATAPCGPDGTIVVIGMLTWSPSSLGWIGTWRACWKGTRHEWSIYGVGYDQAFANIVQGAMLLASGRGDPEGLPTH